MQRQAGCEAIVAADPHPWPFACPQPSLIVMPMSLSIQPLESCRTWSQVRGTPVLCVSCGCAQNGFVGDGLLSLFPVTLRIVPLPWPMLHVLVLGGSGSEAFDGGSSSEASEYGTAEGDADGARRKLTCASEEHFPTSGRGSAYSCYQPAAPGVLCVSCFPVRRPLVSFKYERKL